MLMVDGPVPTRFDRRESVLDGDSVQAVIIKSLLPGQEVLCRDPHRGQITDEDGIPALADGEVAPLREQVWRCLYRSRLRLLCSQSRWRSQSMATVRAARPLCRRSATARRWSRNSLRASR